MINKSVHYSLKNSGKECSEKTIGNRPRYILRSSTSLPIKGRGIPLIHRCCVYLTTVIIVVLSYVKTYYEMHRSDSKQGSDYFAIFSFLAELL